MSPVKRGRLRLGLTQAELAEKCRQAGAAATNMQISRIERALQSPRPGLRRALSSILDIDLLWDLPQEAEEAAQEVPS